MRNFCCLILCALLLCGAAGAESDGESIPFRADGTAPEPVMQALALYFDPETADYGSLEGHVSYRCDLVWCRAEDRDMWHVVLVLNDMPGGGEFDVVLDAETREVRYHVPEAWLAACGKLEGVAEPDYWNWRDGVFRAYEEAWGEHSNFWSWEKWLLVDFETAKAIAPGWNYWYVTVPPDTEAGHDRAVEAGAARIRELFPEAERIEQYGDALYTVWKTRGGQACYPLPEAWWQIDYAVDGERYFLNISEPDAEKIECYPLS